MDRRLTTPRVLLLDIETAPNKGYFWGLFKENIPYEHIEESRFILCWSAAWLHERRIQYASLATTSRRTMLRRIHRLLDQADIVVHYNGLKFDIPTLNTEFVRERFRPPSPYKQIDLYKEVKSVFRFESNKLDYVAQVLGIGKKVRHRGFSLWVGCMSGDPQCWREMKRYNKNDVQILTRLYHILRPWLTTHPTVATPSTTSQQCPRCGSAKVVQRGVMTAITRVYPRYTCRACGAWFRSPRPFPTRGRRGGPQKGQGS